MRNNLEKIASLWFYRQKPEKQRQLREMYYPATPNMVLKQNKSYLLNIYNKEHESENKNR